MVTSTYGDTFLIEQGAYLWHRDAIEHETHYRHTILRIAQKGESRNLTQLLACILGEFVLVSLDISNA